MSPTPSMCFSAYFLSANIKYTSFVTPWKISPQHMALFSEQSILFQNTLKPGQTLDALFKYQ